jgi:hypothetical protein
MPVTLTKQEEQIFHKATQTNNWNLFTEYFFQLPKSGTWFTPEDRIDQYTVLYSAWKKAGKPDSEITLDIDGVLTSFPISWNVGHYSNNPLFLLPHGFRMLPWLIKFLDPNIPLGAAITGTGTGKTCGVAIFALMCCALFPGFRFLNVAPSTQQAELMLGEVEKWCANTIFRKFVRETRGVNPLWIARPHPTLTIEVYPGHPSTFVCQTVRNDARGVIGSERDFINCDEAQLLTGIEEGTHILATRLRGTRSTGDLRWGMLRWISNPGQNAELTALMEHYQTIEKKTGEAIVLTHVESSVNIYVTKKQLANQKLSLIGQRAQDRWHGGDPDTVWEDTALDERLLENCKNDELTLYVKDTGLQDDLVGVRRFELPYKDDRHYIVCGDVGKGSVNSLSSMNVPCVMVFDVTDFLADNSKIIFTAFYWPDGEGEYKAFLKTMKHAMRRYKCTGYYDAQNIQTAFEDISGGFEKWPTTPIYFAGGGPKKWAIAVVVQLMQDSWFQWPYIKGLWHQARIFDPASKKRPDDIVATLLVFALALRVESTLYNRLVERYDWDEDDNDETNMYDGAYLEPDDRYGRLG